MGHMKYTGHTGTEKKNPFVMTIGFDKSDPEHVEVAEFLNSLPRKKAQYIVEAVKCYRRMQQEYASDVPMGKVSGKGMPESGGQRDGSPWGEGNAGKPLDKEAIRRIVLQVLTERADDKERVAKKSIPQPAIHERTKLQPDTQDTNADIASATDTVPGANIAPDTEPDTAAGMIAGIDQSDLELIFGSLEALRG